MSGNRKSVGKPLLSKSNILFVLLAFVFVSNIFANDKDNTWIELPIVGAMEYFGGIIITAQQWAKRYAYLFGVVGLVWSALKVMLSRMAVKELWWDTFFKWFGFIVLISVYPIITAVFMNLGNEIGMKAGGGRTRLINEITQLQEKITADLATIESNAANAANKVLESHLSGTTIDTQYSGNYDEYWDNVSNFVSVTKFKSKSDKEKAMAELEEIRAWAEIDKKLYGGSTLEAIDKVLKKTDVYETDSTTGQKYYVKTYLDLNIYLRDYEGKETNIISPSSLLRLTLLTCQIMRAKQNQRFERIKKDIKDNKDLNILEKGTESIAAQMKQIPETIMYLFCCIVLIAATVFAGIQYIMTILEYTIIAGIGAIFIPLILFDGTKDIPKKLIPVFISFMVKIIVITICLMYVYDVMVEHTANMIADDGGMNWTTVGEIMFESVLIYVLTQNAPKVAQTILTGQPQLSMGEALQAGGTVAATGAIMSQAPRAAGRLYAKGAGKVGELGAYVAKNNAASRAAKESLGANATGFQRFAAGTAARGATVTRDVADRLRARLDNGMRSNGTGITMLDKALNMMGYAGGSSGGSSGSAGAASAYKQTGQWKDKDEIRPMNSSSNPDLRTATKYDDRTGQQRNMTMDEWTAEKIRQGHDVGSSVGERMRQHIDNANKNKADNPEIAKSDSKGERMS